MNNRFVRGRRINTRNIVIDAEVVENNNIYKNKNFNNVEKVPVGVVVIFSVVLSLISGFLGAYFVISYNADNTSFNDGIITSNLELKEASSISSAVNKVYDAVGVVEVYDKDSLISTGTGFIYKIDNNKAYLMTNNHVISSEGDIKFLFQNGEEVAAEIVGSDIYSDIAVLSIDKSDSVVAAVLGVADKVSVGDTVFTVGSPEGSDYAGTVTKGIISAKERVVEVSLSSNNASDYYMEVMQTDAAINPGNSGGPICNINGEVIGITNMKLVDDTVEGMGFAIPIDDALKVAEILEKDGKVSRPYVGVEILDLSNEINLWRAGILIPEEVDGGVAVYSVVDGSPADVAGLKKGDIIVNLGDKDINNMADFRYSLYKYSPEDKIKVTYVRGDEKKVTEIVLGKSE